MPSGAAVPAFKVKEPLENPLKPKKGAPLLFRKDPGETSRLGFGA